MDKLTSLLLWLTIQLVYSSVSLKVIESQPYTYNGLQFGPQPWRHWRVILAENNHVSEWQLSELVQFRCWLHVMTVTITWPLTATILNHAVTPIVMIWSCPIKWLFPHTSPSPYVPWPWYTVFHSCGAFCQTCVPAYVHSLLHRIMFMPLLTLYFLHSDPMPHAFPLLYVPLCMTYAHLPHRTLNSPDTIMSSDPTCLII